MLNHIEGKTSIALLYYLSLQQKFREIIWLAKGILATSRKRARFDDLLLNYILRIIINIYKSNVGIDISGINCDRLIVICDRELAVAWFKPVENAMHLFTRA